MHFKLVACFHNNSLNARGSITQKSTEYHKKYIRAKHKIYIILKLNEANYRVFSYFLEAHRAEKHIGGKSTIRAEERFIYAQNRTAQHRTEQGTQRSEVQCNSQSSSQPANHPSLQSSKIMKMYWSGVHKVKASSYFPTHTTTRLCGV